MNVVFHESRGLARPASVDHSYPLLDSISDVQDFARGLSGFGSEVSSMSLVLDDSRHIAYGLIGIPLGVECSVYEDDNLIFSGVVTTVDLSISMTIGIES
ncbi:MAG: hypothetical protein ACKO0Z_08010 [Betaproteobacteria bacterium]